MNSEIDFNQFYDEHSGRRIYSRSPCLYNTPEMPERRIRASSESSSLTKEMVSIIKKVDDCFYVCKFFSFMRVLIVSQIDVSVKVGKIIAKY